MYVRTSSYKAGRPINERIQIFNFFSILPGNQALFPGKIISGFDRFNPESTNLPFLGIESRRRSNRAIKRAKTILTELATLRPVVGVSLARSRVFMVICAGAKSELTQTRSARRETP